MLDTLRKREFVPNDDGTTFDLSFGQSYTDRMVRVAMDDIEVIILLMTGNEVELWAVNLQNVPLEIFTENLNMVTRAARHDAR